MALSEYAKPTFSGWSLWLSPPRGSQAHEVTSAIIREQSERLQTVNFDPHITLLPAIVAPEADALRMSEELATKIKPYSVQLIGASVGQLYFQCVYAKVDPTAEVLEANKLARDAFSKHSDPPYMPHLSLVYGDVDEEVKQRAAAEVNDRVAGLTFQVDSFELWNTNGKPADWYLVKSFRLAPL
eukprot:comp20468_c0_seq1/m.26080 comp20468_c0_seq1/g.26080  ORF comp20468_c0_seq1/g.26080 comp20468_c0_seq1/m.26080 type:complete len:184 (-) comp20468_c0_seq1:90-641(-)